MERMPEAFEDVLYYQSSNLEMADEPVKIEEELKEEIPEVLQESDVEQFSTEPETVVEEEPEEETPTEEPEEEEPLAPEPEEEEPEPEPEVEEEPEPQVEEEPPVVSPSPARRTSVVSPNENQNPEFGSPKKLGGGVWPPREENVQRQGQTDEGVTTKKRVSDLIARFNSGTIENEGGKADQKYKQEYGAGKGTGKVQQSVFQ